MTTLPVTELQLRSASLCLPDSDPVAVPPRLLRRLSRATATARHGEESPSCADPRTTRVVATSTWGDPFELYVGACTSFSLAYAPGVEASSFELPVGAVDDLFALGE